jgi:hypothetical protein
MANSSLGTIIGLGVAAAAAYALYEYLQSACASGGSMAGGTVCGFLSPLGITPAAVSVAATTQGSTAAPVAKTTATLTNVTAPGQPFAAGDNFQLLVTGPANSPVIGTASQNGAVTSSTNFGTTNSAGQFLTTGSWDSTDVGAWVESWQVGSATPASLVFSIAGSGVSGLGAINRIPRGLIHRGKIARG